jgi:hypothetical protein
MNVISDTKIRKKWVKRKKHPGFELKTFNSKKGMTLEKRVKVLPLQSTTTIINIRYKKSR